MFRPAVCSRRHDVLMMSMNFNNIATLNIYGIINGISTSESINLLTNADLSKTSDHYKI